jgi:hypothetical protein
MRITTDLEMVVTRVVVVCGFGARASGWVASTG